jgi:hypothetical protein
MPQFFFAVGLAYRLTIRKRLASGRRWPAYGHALTRCAGLILFGVVLYHLDGRAESWADLKRLGWQGFLTSAFQREPFQALVHIGLTSIWVLPVIAAPPIVRIAFTIASAVLHLALSRWFYFEWAWNRPAIDGGPLGFLSWAIPLLAGSLAFDLIALGGRGALRRIAGWSVVLMALGYMLSCLGLIGASPGVASKWLAAPPFLPPHRAVDLWTMSQRTGSISYQIFSAGFSLAVFGIFVLACDQGRLQVGIFRTFGRNALAAYVLHDLVGAAVKPYAPADSPLSYALLALGLYFMITYLFVRHLEKDGIFIRM